MKKWSLIVIGQNIAITYYLKVSVSHYSNDLIFDWFAEVARDEEDGGGIVLGPQRKSFDTGCHVSTLNKSDR